MLKSLQGGVIEQIHALLPQMNVQVQVLTGLFPIHI